MKKLLDFNIIGNRIIARQTHQLLLEAPAGEEMPEVEPGQFVEVEVPGGGVLLRRPISVNRYDRDARRLQLVIKRAGKGTDTLCDLPAGSRVNILFPLGNGFTMPEPGESSPLLVGGGVGIAPLLYLGEKLAQAGCKPEFLLAGRSRDDLFQLEEFGRLGQVFTATEEASEGSHHGMVTTSPRLLAGARRIYCCGPMPMMKAVAKIASTMEGCRCEVSLENKMACGLGACLCCVEDTREGHKCVCTYGPVFEITELKW